MKIVQCGHWGVFDLAYQTKEVGGREDGMSDIAKIREGMAVVALDGREVGKVIAIGTWRLVLTSNKDGSAFDHLIPLSWVEEVERYVFLNKGSRYVAANWDAPAPIANTHLRPKAA